MPIFLNPPPRHIRITRQNFTPPERPTLRIDPLVAPVAEMAVERLVALLPGIQQTRKIDIPAEVRLSPLEPESAACFRLEVSEAGVHLCASRREGFLYGAEIFRQLLDEGEFIGVVIEDSPAFPTREVFLPLPAATIAPAYWPTLLENLAWCRFNRLSLAEGDEKTLVEPRRLGAALAIEIGVRTAAPSEAPALVTSGAAAARPPALLALREHALRASEAGHDAFCLHAGPLDDETFLDPLWFALAFAGACAWNPRKADLRALRRSFADQFYGPGAAEAQTTLDALEDGLASEENTLSGESAPLATLFREDPFAPQFLRRLLRGPERAREAQAHAQRALLALEAAREDVSRNAAALEALAWPVHRLDLHAEHLLSLQRARETYADAFLSTGNPRAASKRVLTTAEELGGLANRIVAHEAALREQWTRERAGSPPEATLDRYAERVQTLRGKAAELRELRDRYVQTGNLPAPEAVGLDRSAGRMERVALAGRLPRRHSPPWWPEGGAARVRIETRSEGGPAIPWEIPIDLRELAGEESAFHVGGGRLVCFDDATDAVGPDVPFQLTRSGLLFAPEEGARVYYLYLDPKGEPTSDALRSRLSALRGNEGPGLPSSRTESREQRAESTSEATTRVRQPRSGIIVETPTLLLRAERDTGAIDRWQARHPSRGDVEDLLDGEEGGGTRLCIVPEVTSGPPPRLRVVEHGPVLTRIQAEHADGRVCQYDVFTGTTASGGTAWCEFATNAPVPVVEHMLQPGPWALADEEVTYAVAGSPPHALTSSPPHSPAEATALWAARTRSDGLTFAVLCPDGPARHRLSRARHAVEGAPLLSRLVLWSAWSDESPPEARLEALTRALQHPPTVNFGPIEERRAREF